MTSPARDAMAALWANRAARVAVTAGLGLAAGLATAWVTPRGPLTAGGLLATSLAMVGLGMAGGVVLGTRWTWLLLPTAYMVGLEVGRVEVDGATIDAIRLSSPLGLMAFLVGRVAHAAMVGPALLLGIGYGIWAAQRLGHPAAPAPGTAARVMTALATLGVVVTVGALAWPGSTAPITGPDGAPLEGSVAELATVEVGGVPQVLMIRGRDATNPVLLYLSGGPGGTDLGAMRADSGLEEDFVVVTWEQRGTGQSYATSIDPTEQLTLARAVADTLEVTDHLRERFGVDRVYLVANSWGTIPSVLAVQQAPDRFHAYVGTGQMVNNRLTDQMFYEDAMAWAQGRGDEQLVARMRAAGPPPYDDLVDYEFTAAYEHRWNRYPGVDDLWEMPFNTFVAENGLLDRVNAARGMFDVNSVVYPQLQDHDFREDVTALEVPVWMVLGAHEARGRAVLAEEWFALLDAPVKHAVTFTDSGHRPLFEEPAAFAALMREVLAATAGHP